MSSDLQSALEFLQTNNYLSVVVITAITYDYILTFSREVDYIWLKPWTFVSVMFIVIRYVGLCFTYASGLFGSTFVPGPVKVQVYQPIVLHDITEQYWHSKGSALNLIGIWGFPVFLAATDLVMILRVYAMWNQSKWVFAFLILLDVPQILSFLILRGIYDNPNTYLSVMITQLNGFSFCNLSSTAPPLLDIYNLFPLFVFGLALLILALIQTLKQTIQMYRATKQWQPNRYIQQFVQDGIAYFLLSAVLNFTLAWLTTDPTINATLLLVLNSLSYIALFPVMPPRFIISIRELYDRDRRGQWRGVDTGFGMFSHHGVSDDTVVSAIAFADAAPRQVQSQVTEGEGGDDSETIQLERLGDSAQRV